MGKGCGSCGLMRCLSACCLSGRSCEEVAAPLARCWNDACRRGWTICLISGFLLTASGNVLNTVTKMILKSSFDSEWSSR